MAITNDSTLLITGANGMVGKNLKAYLESQGYTKLLTPLRDQLDLLDTQSIASYCKTHHIDAFVHLAARVGGIAANQADPTAFLEENLLLNTQFLKVMREHDIKQGIILGSSCIYPRLCDQPMKESMLLTGPLEPTNEGYAISKIAALKYAQYANTQYGMKWITLMPPNMYGPYDHFGTKQSHVVSALLTKFHHATTTGEPAVTLWGSGKAKREFLYVQDLCHAIEYFLTQSTQAHKHPFVNVGCGSDVTIMELAQLIKTITKFDGTIQTDTSHPDGMPQKLMDSSRAELMGWTAQTQLSEGLEKTYEWYKKQLQ